MTKSEPSGAPEGRPMLIAEAQVETDRSSRYLVQLCRHVHKVAQRDPRMRAHVQWSDDRGVISFGWGGRCTLRADPGVLTLRAEATDGESLRRLEERVADRLERFGRRDHLTVTWSPPQGAAEGPPASSRDGDPVRHPPRYPHAGDHGGAGNETEAGPDHGSTGGMQGWGTKVILIIVILLIALVFIGHLILGGGFRGIHGP